MGKSVAVSLLLTIMLTGCGGSSSTDFSPSDDPSGTPQNQNGVNGNLAGSIAAGYSSNIVTNRDLYTGVSTTLPFEVIKSVVENDPELDFAATTNHITMSDGTANAAFVQTYMRCIDVDTLGSRGNACYTLYGSDLAPVSTQRLNFLELDVPLRLSRSQKYILANDYTRARDAEDMNIHLSILDAISSDSILTIPIRAAREFGNEKRLGRASAEWGLQDEIIYTDARDQPPVVYITKPLSAEVAQRIRLPSQYRGLINKMHLSPDGTMLLLDYARETDGAGGGSFPIILDLNTLDVRIPAVHSLDADSIPVGDQSGTGTLVTQGWSPDSRWILLTSATYTQLSEQQLMYRDFEVVAVPSDGVSQVVSHDQSVAAPGVVWVRFRNNSGKLVALGGGGGLIYNWFDDH